MITLNRFDLVSLRLYVAVVDAGSLTAGATRFGTSLAAASKRIVQLEADVGVSLLRRSKRGVSPTPAGQTLYRYSLKVIGDLEQMAVALGDYGQGVESHVRLWGNTSAVNGRLPEVIAAYLAAHRRTRIDLEEALSEAIVRAVETGLADLGVFADNVPHGGLQTVPCDVDDLVLLTPPGHPLARRRSVRFAQALDHDFVGLERSASLMRLASDEAARLGKALRIRVQVRSFDAMCRMVAQGIGVGVLPRAAAAPHVTSMKLSPVRIDEPWARRRLLLGWRDRARLSDAAWALAKMLGAGD